jgi:hypothetical protein
MIRPAAGLRTCLLGLWATGVLPATATAQIPFNACLDRSGAPVRQEESTELPNLAWASWVGDHQPVIYWNRRAMAGVSEVSRLFVYLHECAHITLRHVYGHATTIEERRKQEDEADCWAIQLMLDAGMIKGRHLDQLEREWRHSAGDLTHQSGRELVHSFQSCLSIRIDARRWRAVLDSLLPAARDSFRGITGEPIAGSGGDKARESTLDLPGTYDCEIRASGNFFCVVFASREAKPALRRQVELSRILREWMGSEWTISERELAEGPETRRFLAEHVASGAIIALSSASGGRVLFLARPATH